MIQVIMPMAGVGSRFESSHPGCFKPLIEVEGLALFRHSLNSLRNLSISKTIFVLTEEDYERFNLKEELILNDWESIKVIKGRTKGALETCLLGIEELDPLLPLVLLDCDLKFESKDLEDFFIGSTKGLGFPCFTSSDPRFSFCKEENNSVVEVREKMAISNKAIAGAYCFDSLARFEKLARQALDKELTENSEYYISSLFNKVQNVWAFETESYTSLGTPEEVNLYLESKK